MHEHYTVEDLLLDESFIDYCHNKSSAHKAKWETFMNQSAAQQIMVNEAKQLLALLDPRLPDNEINEEVNKIRSQLSLKSGSEPEKAEPAFFFDNTMQEKPPVKKKKIAGLVAAICMTAIITAVFVFQRPSATRDRSDVLALYQTKTGERKQMTLPDGSYIILNSDSKLSLVGDFNNKERRLRLEGQAYFNVAKNPGKPFIVETGRFSTTAIGTTFYIDGRNPATNYTVSLVEGKVKLQSGDEESTFLTAGEKAAWTDHSASFSKSNTDTSNLQNWVSGRITLDRETAANAFNLLSRWYGVTIEDQRTERPGILISGNYEGQNLEDVLKIICFTLSCNYQIQHNKIIIH